MSSVSIRSKASMWRHGERVKTAEAAAALPRSSLSAAISVSFTKLGDLLFNSGNLSQDSI